MPVWLVLLALLQDLSPSEKIRQQMEKSLAQQRESVQKQFASIRGIQPIADPGFFTVPWPRETQPIAAPQASLDCDPLPPAMLDPIIEKASTRQGIASALLQSIIRQESAGRPCAISVKGAQGLMQLMPETAQTLGVTDPFDPEENVEAGSRLLRSLLTRFNGDLPLALGAYNAGAGAVQKYGGLPPYAETQNYVSEILKRVVGKPETSD
jgi:soluble lytic murein transglycosylase-like protein